ncbi:N-acetyltransferase [Streptomyces sp. 8K308]|uniref:GNAT family N-acetyltransferase n=1 Tax=Streptomyces sp. 8K308 TaxID=2530388 RepID=UPI00104A79AF|nr:GNAT family N-acetyltransferase [Streptomyces sp. 8K308]TDC26394.1 N-acetyltransferase [Streptomyces sp. 8K308]
MTFTFRRLAEPDFPLLAGWLARPHVARWWHHETSAEAVARDFGPAARADEPSDDLLALLDGRAVGLVQRCAFADYPEYRAELAAVVPVPAGAVTVDYLLGDPELLGRGLGTAMIGAALELAWAELPDARCVLVPVVAANRASWRALERAGLRRVGAGELTPDNPVDDPLHYVYRVDRPSVTSQDGI